MEIKETSKKVFTNDLHLVVAGNNVEATQVSSFNKSPITKKISKNQWLNLQTGEIITKEVSDKQKNKSQNIKSVKQTVKKIRNLINANFNGMSDNEYFITLTYKENMQDTKRLYKDFEKFIKRLKYDFENLLYIGVVEPQKRGAWHVHLLLKDIKVDNDYISDRWGLGFTYTTVLDSVENVGAYLSAYLTNTSDKKGERLHMYPQNLKIVRYSRNCKRPYKLKLYYKDFYKHFKHLKLKYVKSYDLFNGYQKINSVIYKSFVVGD